MHACIGTSLAYKSDVRGVRRSFNTRLQSRFFVEPGVKTNSAYYRDVLLTQKLLQVTGHINISGNEYVFQQDSPPALRAHETIKLSSYAERRDALYFTGTVATEQSRS